MALRAGNDLEDLAMPSTMLTIVSTMVDFEGRREQPGNKARLLLAEEVMIWAREMARAHLIVFPAGFLCATDVAEARALVGRVMASAKQRSLAVVVGVDLCTTDEFQKGSGKAGNEDIDLLVSQGQLPFFLYTWAPDMPILTEWRQRSTTGENGVLAPPKESGERRLLKVHGHWVDVVACRYCFPHLPRLAYLERHRALRQRCRAAHASVRASSGLPVWATAAPR
jgi:hypothetical protein